jgi:hypothetical protein
MAWAKNMAIITAFERWEQEDCGLEASLCYMERVCVKNNYK